MIAGHAFIAAIASEDGFHFLGGELRHGHRRDGGTVTERFAVVLHECRQRAERIDIEPVQAVHGAKSRCCFLGPRRFIVGRIVETNAEGVHWRCHALLRQRHDGGRIESAGEKRTHRHVGDEMRTHRIAQRRIECFEPLVVAAKRRGVELRPPVTLRPVNAPVVVH